MLLGGCAAPPRPLQSVTWHWLRRLRRRRRKEMSLLKTLYALAIALLVVAFVGFGSSGFG